MAKKAKTIKVSGSDYAKVAERLKLFREDCPHGLIDTEMKVQEENVIFKARVLKDKSKLDSAEATAHAVGSIKGTKAYEKQESIAVGRALAMLGYLASGEIATSEEMEEFEEYKQNRQEQIEGEAIDKINECKTLKELASVYAGFIPQQKTVKVIELKDTLKSKLSKNEDTK